MGTAHLLWVTGVTIPSCSRRSNSWLMASLIAKGIGWALWNLGVASACTLLVAVKGWICPRVSSKSSFFRCKRVFSGLNLELHAVNMLFQFIVFEPVVSITGYYNEYELLLLAKIVHSHVESPKYFHWFIGVGLQNDVWRMESLSGKYNLLGGLWDNWEGRTCVHLYLEFVLIQQQCHNNEVWVRAFRNLVKIIFFTADICFTSTGSSPKTWFVLLLCPCGYAFLLLGGFEQKTVVMCPVFLQAWHSASLNLHSDGLWFERSQW